MLDDPHLSVPVYEPLASKVFPDTDFKGGIAITMRNTLYIKKPIGLFIPFKELRTIVDKTRHGTREYISAFIYSPESYKLTDCLHDEHPDAESKLSRGHKYDVVTNIFDKLPDMFLEMKTRNK